VEQLASRKASSTHTIKEEQGKVRTINCKEEGAKMASQAEEDENSQRGFVNPPRGFEKSPRGFENLKNTIGFIIKQCLHPDGAGVWSENFL
jgi:hypothetical protein